MIGLPFSIRIHTLLNFPAKGFCYGRKHNLSVYNIQALSHAFYHPRSANLLAYGSVALVNAKGEVHGTAPGIFATQ